MDRSDEIRDDYYEHADEWHADRIERTDTADDRSDDRPDDRSDDRPDATSDDDRAPSGDVLGIGRANPPRDHVPSSDDHVGLTETETGRAGSREVQRSPGATSIDMGAGGTGTDIERP